MVDRRFRLAARVSSARPAPLRAVLERLVPEGSIRQEGEGFVVEGELEGASAQDLNRSLLSSLRRVEKRTRIRSEWTAEDGTTWRFFDYVLKETSKK